MCMSFCMRFFSEESILHSAIQEGDNKKFYEQAKFRDLNKHYGIFTPLQICILYNRHEYITFLLEEKKVNPNATYLDEEDNRTKITMSLAVVQEDVPTIKLLVFYGADPENTHFTDSRKHLIDYAVQVQEVYKKYKKLEEQLKETSFVEDKIRINQELYKIWHAQLDFSQPAPYNNLYARKAEKYKNEIEKFIKEKEESKRNSNESTPFLASLK